MMIFIRVSGAGDRPGGRDDAGGGHQRGQPRESGGGGSAAGTNGNTGMTEIIISGSPRCHVADTSLSITLRRYGKSA